MLKLRITVLNNMVVFEKPKIYIFGDDDDDNGYVIQRLTIVSNIDWLILDDSRESISNVIFAILFHCGNSHF
ncbi:hypothetical protein DERP_012491 [Dermatophagoides pteronyssinus]|uniref:Uncharacterized protein n=1 Tax=Dermatophagoides pteronyssinus TaxID=6956 RepID=A0ABQ8IX46_DERPT|nr:hypothetical protein DERP_012491 [Dermatophagoides pteronyssinus]